MRLEVSGPPSRKRLVFSIQAPETRPGYLQMQMRMMGRERRQKGVREARHGGTWVERTAGGSVRCAASARPSISAGAMDERMVSHSAGGMPGRGF
jgi:hypothetical protein